MHVVVRWFGGITIQPNQYTLNSVCRLMPTVCIWSHLNNVILLLSFLHLLRPPHYSDICTNCGITNCTSASHGDCWSFASDQETNRNKPLSKVYWLWKHWPFRTLLLLLQIQFPPEQTPTPCNWLDVMSCQWLCGGVWQRVNWLSVLWNFNPSVINLNFKLYLPERVPITALSIIWPPLALLRLLMCTFI